MRVVGTAGHVDHGKSTLVHFLTGIDPDRLREEKQRAMTIDLGFAWMPLDDGEMLGIVDVPGHRDFIENMLAGVGGIDAVILVIAADEGVMPQTREHLAIIDLLDIPTGIIALSKIDLVKDPEWLELVQLDVAEVVKNTVLRNAPLIPVSAHTGEGMDQLVQSLQAQLATLPAQKNTGFPRLAIDRVFTVSGFGTVVTGTLLGGTLAVGEEIEIYPSDLRGRVRGLQSYHDAVQLAQPGSRVAVNVSGIEKNEVKRGDVLAVPGSLKPTTMIDAYYRHLPDASRSLKHNTEVKVFAGAAEAVARVRLLDAHEILPGAEGWIQLRLSQPLAVARNDAFILRIPSPAETTGGGRIADPNPRRRWKRFQPDLIERLSIIMSGTPEEQLIQAASSRDGIHYDVLQKAVTLNASEFDSTLRKALDEQALIEMNSDLYMAFSIFQAIRDEMKTILGQYHAENPLQPGMPREVLRQRLKVSQEVLQTITTTDSEINMDGQQVRLADHRIRFTPEQSARIDALMDLMHDAPYTPPSFAEAAEIVGEPVLYALIDRGEIVRVQPDIVFLHDTYAEMVDAIFDFIDSEGSVDAKRLRDQFNTSRKYAIGLLEHLDAVGLTRRVGDSRVSGKNR
jgi:selenocysteine-specific elongation factor